MQLGLIANGSMELDMARILAAGRHDVSVLSFSAEEPVRGQRLKPADSLRDLVAQLKGPRIVWIMTPALKIDGIIEELTSLMDEGDIILNSAHNQIQDDLDYAETLQRKGIFYLDIGLVIHCGFSFMVGGERSVFERIEPLLAVLAHKGGYIYCGKCGSGRHVKSVFDETESAINKVYANAGTALKTAPCEHDLDFPEFMLFTQKYCKGSPCSMVAHAINHA